MGGVLETGKGPGTTVSLSGPARSPTQHTNMNETPSPRAIQGLAPSPSIATLVPEPERRTLARTAQRVDVSEVPRILWGRNAGQGCKQPHRSRLVPDGWLVRLVSQPVD